MIGFNDDQQEKRVRIIVPASVAALSMCVAFGCFAANLTTRSQATRGETTGNLTSKDDFGCIGADKLGNKNTPIGLYNAVSKCVEAGKYREGAFLFAMAGVYGRFDTYRVVDKSAYSVIPMARMQAFKALDRNERFALEDSIKRTLTGNPEDLAAACEDIRRIGPPSYYPRYMVQYGMDAFINGASNGLGLVKDFDAKAAWKRSLTTYMHCPGL